MLAGMANSSVLGTPVPYAGVPTLPRRFSRAAPCGEEGGAAA
jgi:hypothetical protein